MANNGSNGPRRPTTDQRRAMAQLAEEIFSSRIQEARDEEGALVQEITQDLRQELGVDTLDNQIGTLEHQIKILEKKKAGLGWGHYDRFIEDSRAGRLLKGRVAKRSNPVRDLERERKRVLATIWTCDSIDEMNEMVNNL